jgi:hypothetical protein
MGHDYSRMYIECKLALERNLSDIRLSKWTISISA